MLTARSVIERIKESLRSAPTYRIKIGDDAEKTLPNTADLKQYVNQYMKYSNVNKYPGSSPCSIFNIPDNKSMYSGTIDGALKYLGVT